MGDFTITMIYVNYSVPPMTVYFGTTNISLEVIQIDFGSPLLKRIFLWHTTHLNLDI